MRLSSFFSGLAVSVMPTSMLFISTSSALSPWEQIHQTLHTYALAIDSKTPSLLPQVFAPDAFANYTGPLSNLTGLPAISAGLQASVANLLSQHQLGTTVINIDPCGDKANSTTYFTASLFGDGKKYAADQYVYLYGQYQDVLVRREEAWRILRRQLVFMGPYVGNTSLLGG